MKGVYVPLQEIDMPRARSKDELTTFAKENFKKLMDLADSMTEKELNTPFDFSGLAKTEAHWNRDKNLRDVFVHLYEWHQLMLAFVKNNEKGKLPIAFLPAQYNWKTYGDMNVEIWSKHQETSLKDAKAMLKKSHDAVMKLADKFSNEELFTKRHFKWTGTTDLGSYFVSTTSSHYDWAIKKIKLHQKNCK